MHPRKKIRDAISALLMNETAAGDRVFPSRSRPMPEDKLPCIFVYSNSESPVEIAIEAPRTYRRNLTNSVEIVAADDEGLDDLLDSIAEDVERALRQRHTLADPALGPSGALCEDTILTGVEITQSDNGRTLIGSCVMTYQTPYYSESVADQTVENHFGDFDQNNTDWRGPKTPSGQFDAQDEIDLSEA